MCPKLVRDGRADDLLDEPLRADGDGGEGHALDGLGGNSIEFFWIDIWLEKQLEILF